MRTRTLFGTDWVDDCLPLSARVGCERIYGTCHAYNTLVASSNERPSLRSVRPGRSDLTWCPLAKMAARTLTGTPRPLSE
eukprot:9765078-Alexandrium_andersonii.AAC.1